MRIPEFTKSIPDVSVKKPNLSAFKTSLRVRWAFQHSRFYREHGGCLVLLGLDESGGVALSADVDGELTLLFVRRHQDAEPTNQNTVNQFLARCWSRILVHLEVLTPVGYRATNLLKNGVFPKNCMKTAWFWKKKHHLCGRGEGDVDPLVLCPVSRPFSPFLISLPLSWTPPPLSLCLLILETRKHQISFSLFSFSSSSLRFCLSRSLILSVHFSLSLSSDQFALSKCLFLFILFFFVSFLLSLSQRFSNLPVCLSVSLSLSQSLWGQRARSSCPCTLPGHWAWEAASLQWLKVILYKWTPKGRN